MNRSLDVVIIMSDICTDGLIDRTGDLSRTERVRHATLAAPFCLDLFPKTPNFRSIGLASFDDADIFCRSDRIEWLLSGRFF